MAGLVDLLRGQEILLLLGRRRVDIGREVFGHGVLAVEEHGELPAHAAALEVGQALPALRVAQEVDLAHAPVALLPARVEVLVGNVGGADGGGQGRISGAGGYLRPRLGFRVVSARLLSESGYTRKDPIAAGAVAGALGAAGPAEARRRKKKRKRRKRKGRRTYPAPTWSSSAPGSPASPRRARSPQAGRSVIVLEARDRVGGRVLNHPLGGGGYAELGGMFIGPDAGPHPGARQGASASGRSRPTTPATTSSGRQRPALGVSRTTRRSAPRRPTRSSPADIALAVAAARPDGGERPRRRARGRAANADEWDRQTLDTWLRDNTSGSAEFMAVVSAATEAIFGGEPRELSLLYTLFYIAASGNEQNVGHLRAQLQHRRRRAGAALRRRRAADRAAGGGRARRAASLLGAPVRRIAQTRRGVTVYADTRQGDARKRVIVAIPPTLAGAHRLRAAAAARCATSSRSACRRAR